MKYLLTVILCCLLFSCTTTVVKPLERPDLVGTWAASTDIKFSIDKDGHLSNTPFGTYQNTFRRSDTIVITPDTIRHIQLIRTMDSVLLGDTSGNLGYGSGMFPIWAPKDSILYHDTVSLSTYETSGDGYNIYQLNPRFLDNEIGNDRIYKLPYSANYFTSVREFIYYSFYRSKDPTFINTEGQIEQFTYYQLASSVLMVPIRYNKIR